ncbi:MAG: recombinase RecT, partial [Methylocystis sp.]|nr:recombinase RecT [Methylocystis sp.]
MSMIEQTEIERRIADRVDTSIAGALEISRHAGGIAFTNAGEAMEFAKMMAVSQIGVRKHLRGNVGACLAITVQAIEWNMSPFAVANKSYLVNDQIAYESQLIQAVILRRAPIKGRFKFTYSGDGEKRRCKVVATLMDGDTVDYETPEIGKIPVKNSPLWKGDPDQQLSYYAGRALCRRNFPDVLLGVYDIDEIQKAPPSPEMALAAPPSDKLALQLEALASPPPSNAIAHDPETGEVAMADEADAEAQSGVATEATATEADGGDSEEPNEILDAARKRAIRGRKAFNLWFSSL